MPLLAVAMPMYERQLVDQVVGANRLDLLAQTIGSYAALWLAVLVVQQLTSVMRAYLAERYLLQLRQRVFDQCGRLAVAFSQRQHSSRTLALFAHDVPAVAGFINTALVLGVASVVAIVATVMTMFSMSAQLAVAGALAPIAVALFGFVVTRPLRPASRRVQEKVAEVAQRLQEHLAGIREISAFGRERSEQAHFASTLNSLLPVASTRHHARHRNPEQSRLAVPGRHARSAWLRQLPGHSGPDNAWHSDRHAQPVRHVVPAACSDHGTHLSPPASAGVCRPRPGVPGREAAHFNRGPSARAQRANLRSSRIRERFVRLFS